MRAGRPPRADEASTTSIRVRVTGAEKARARALAEARGVSLSGLVRALVEDAFLLERATGDRVDDAVEEVGRPGGAPGLDACSQCGRMSGRRRYTVRGVEGLCAACADRLYRGGK